MDENNSIQLFEDRKIRTAWDEEQEEWYFSVVDVIAVLTDSSNPTDYLKKMRKRDEQLASYLGTNCPQVVSQCFISFTHLFQVVSWIHTICKCSNNIYY